MDNCPLIAPIYPVSVRGYIEKAVLSANPAYTSNYAIMIIYSDLSQLAFIRPGDNAWTPVGKQICLQDIVYFKDVFYAVNEDGEVFACDIRHPQPKLRKVSPPSPQDRNYKVYLVELAGKLLQLKRIAYEYGNTITFKVFELADPPIRHVKYPIGKVKYKVKLMKPTEDMYWVEVNTLSGQAIFLGDNSSFSISSSDFPECKPNCIYFTDDSKRFMRLGMLPHDFGVFNVEEGALEDHPVMTLCKGLLPHPMWLEPTLLVLDDVIGVCSSMFLRGQRKLGRFLQNIFARVKEDWEFRPDDRGPNIHFYPSHRLKDSASLNTPKQPSNGRDKQQGRPNNNLKGRDGKKDKHIPVLLLMTTILTNILHIMGEDKLFREAQEIIDVPNKPLRQYHNVYNHKTDNCYSLIRIFHRIVLAKCLHEYIIDVKKFLDEETKKKEEEHGQGQARLTYMIEIKKGKKRKKDGRITSC
ncbi:hypothetical protein GIB67_037219 [Kingdonia uniflora]|uniref:KIB1-4 beta-propeller domain-containing protein n=1 Tax=Kingdonia uniflora TaxID=39325 RepID=A0A7J7MRZ0_9MAGN|nr:hypothetical protein GIB67_037219 [Kingdonia uniflora]